MAIERPIVFENQGQQLMGVVHEPDGGGKRPGVIFCHGFTGNKIESHRLFVRAARALAAAGYYVLRFDFRGSGESEGEFREATVTGEISDAQAAWQWFKANTDVDSRQVALLGFSLGGAVAAFTAAEVQPQALILWSPVGELVDVFVRNTTLEAMLEKARVQGYLEMQSGWQIGLPFLEELPELNPLAQITKFTGPALFIQGSGDQVVPVQNSHLYYQHAGGADKELHIIEEADHTYNQSVWEKALIDKTVVWLQKKLK